MFLMLAGNAGAHGRTSILGITVCTKSYYPGIRQLSDDDFTNSKTSIWPGLAIRGDYPITAIGRTKFSILDTSFAQNFDI
jgi:hypothetical protein